MLNHRYTALYSSHRYAYQHAWEAIKTDISKGNWKGELPSIVAS